MLLNELALKAQDLPKNASAERVEVLKALATWIASQDSVTSAELIFICTHNSRRSHMGQIWAQAAAWYFGLDHVTTYSGGTEATAFNESAVRALRKLGITIEGVATESNPKYQVRIEADRAPFTAFSKKYDHQVNPQNGFAAVMVCNSADANCPIVPGAAARFAIPYVDPKESDRTEYEAETYEARATEIAVEMFYVMACASELRAKKS